MINDHRLVSVVSLPERCKTLSIYFDKILYRNSYQYRITYITLTHQGIECYKKTQTSSNDSAYTPLRNLQTENDCPWLVTAPTLSVVGRVTPYVWFLCCARWAQQSHSFEPLAIESSCDAFGNRWLTFVNNDQLGRSLNSERNKEKKLRYTLHVLPKDRCSWVIPSCAS